MAVLTHRRDGRIDANGNGGTPSNPLPEKTSTMRHLVLSTLALAGTAAPAASQIRIPPIRLIAGVGSAFLTRHPDCAGDGIKPESGHNGSITAGVRLPIHR